MRPFKTIIILLGFKSYKKYSDVFLKKQKTNLTLIEKNLHRFSLTINHADSQTVLFF